MKQAIVLYLSGFSLAIFGIAQFSPQTLFLNDSPQKNTITEKYLSGNQTIALQAQRRGNPWINLQDGTEQIFTYSGDSDAGQLVNNGETTPQVMAAADFDEDGVPDLVCGYATNSGGILTLHRGNIDSIYPNAPEAIGRKTDGKFFDAPFLADASALSLPESADYLGAGDFDADGHWDVLTARHGSSFLYLMRGDGRGGFNFAKQILLDGIVTSLATGEINRADGLTDVAIGVVAADGAKLFVFEGPEGAMMSEPEIFSLPAEARALSIGQLDDEYTMDLAIGTGAELWIIHGRDRKLSLDESQQTKVPPAVISQYSFESTITSTALGDFTGKRRREIAMLLSNGELKVVSLKKGKSKQLRQNNLILPDDWKESSSMIRAKVSSLPQDDLVFVDKTNSQLHILGGEKEKESTDRVAISLDIDNESIAVLPMRLNVDALQDLVVLKKGQNNLTVAMTAPMSTFVVNSTGDGDDCSGTDGVCSLGTVVKSQCVLTNICTLRAAIQQANVNPGLDSIAFAISSGTQTITPLSALPIINSSVIIDGTTQPGFSGTPIIELNGAGGGVTGLNIAAGNSTVKGLVINRFSNIGIILQNNGSNAVQGNYIGTDVGGIVDLGNGASGVNVLGSNNMIGGTIADTRNIISGNNFMGVLISSSAATGNTVLGNYIGTDLSGTIPLGNSQNGVHMMSGATNNTIGGTSAGTRNIISGNTNHGVSMDPLSGATGNLVQGNYIGTNLSATVSLGNFGGVVPGINNAIGGTTVAARNIISGNNQGILISGSTATGNLVQGNYIGTDVTGTLDLGNSTSGVTAFLSSNNTIGGISAGARNIISGNNSNGVFISGSTATGNQILGNYIGTDVTGTLDLGNSFDGVRISTSAANNIVGGITTEGRNVISGNNSNGVLIESSSNGNIVQGNYIGTDVNGMFDLGNSIYGVSIFSASNNIIGGTSPGGRNIISGNDSHGIIIFTVTGPTATGNIIQGNYIGTDVTGTADLGNSFIGVNILSSTNNIIGGTSAGVRNIISGNNTYGVTISSNSGPNATGNLIQGNYIGTDVNGTSDLGNSLSGVLIALTSFNNTIGGTSAGARNIISGNNNNGVLLTGSNTTNNFVWGNYIGTDVNGTAGLGNSLDGVNINGGASNNSIGGTTAGKRNIISGNNNNGIQISGNTSTGNQLLGNYIGTKADGLGALGNTGHGVFITNSASNNTIGGVSPENWNRIQNNGGDGVYIDSGTGNGIIGNSILGNSGLGIDLGLNGITPNDTGDGDSGANDLQNFPEIGVAQSGNGGTLVRGTLNSTPNASFYIDVYLNQLCNTTPSLRQGRWYVGSTLVTTDPSGNTPFDYAFSTPNIAGQSITATARNGFNNNTSEFSACKMIDTQPINVLRVSTIGQGIVTGDGINCPGDCTQGYSSDTPVILTATAATGWSFAGWTGCTSSSSSCTISMNMSRTVTAIFVRRIQRVYPSGVINNNQTPPVVNPMPVAINAPISLSWFNPVSPLASSLQIDNVKIELSRDGGNNFETIAASSPNDGSECWAVTGPATNQAVIRVSDINDPSVNGTSDYPFSIIAGSGTNPTVGLGNRLCGSLSSGSKSIIKGNSLYIDSYSFDGTNGQQIVISLESSDFDTYLYLRNSGNSIIAQDDNGGGGTNSRIPSGSGFFMLPASGIYTIEATSALPNATGNYTLTLNEPCTYSLSSTSQTFPFTGDSGSVIVSTTNNCSWTAVSKADWITVTSGSNDSGNGTVSFIVAANTSNLSRTGEINVNGQILTITQLSQNPASVRSSFDFDGDGKTDISIFRPAPSEWWYLRSSDGGNRAAQFGAATDRLAPGDFTGDGRTDIAFWRPSNGFWYILRSEDSSFFSFPFGTTGDIPMPTDYDGDGKTDAAVFRPSTATWFILNSGGSGTSIVNFGASGDKPVPADFDGDGKADIAIFRPSDGSWWYLRSSDSQFRVFRFGVSTDKPVQGDYTGDGKADIAVFRPSTGVWFVQRSEDNSFFSFPFGTVGDVPVPGDYDGDAKYDAAVFRPSNSTWYLNQTTAGVGIVTFGAAGDLPVPNAFVP